MRVPIACVSLALLASQLHAQGSPAAGARVQGSGFSIPVPAGLEPVHEGAEAIWSAGGVMVAAPLLEGVYRENILVSSYPVSAAELSLADSAYCDLVGHKFTEQDGTRLVWARVTAVAGGQGCQVVREMENPVPGRQIITAREAPGLVRWAMVCSFGTSDPIAAAAATARCEGSLAGWEFTQD